MNSTEQTLQAVRIDVDGTAHHVTLTPSSDGSYVKAIQHEVGGMFDVVSLSAELDMWLNDEGMSLEMPINWVATILASRLGHIHQPYFGPALFTGGADEAGGTRSLSPEATDQVTAFATGAAVAAKGRPEPTLVVLSDNGEQSVTVACPDEATAHRLGTAAVWSDGDVSAWRVDAEPMVFNEDLVDRLNRGENLESLIERGTVVSEV